MAQLSAESCRQTANADLACECPSNPVHRPYNILAEAAVPFFDPTANPNHYHAEDDWNVECRK